MEEKYPCPPMTPKQWIENFWYYNKWFVLLGIVILTFIGIATFQYITKDDADISILYVGSSSLSDAQCREIISSAKELVPDINSDGEVSVDMQSFVLLSDYDLLSDGQKIQAREEYQEYSDEILSGDGAILLLDEYFYSELAGSGALISLHEIFAELPSSAIDIYGLRLDKTSLYKKEGFSSLPGETILCLKFSPVVSDKTDLEKAELDLIHREIFKTLVEGN